RWNCSSRTYCNGGGTSCACSASGSTTSARGGNGVASSRGAIVAKAAIAPKAATTPMAALRLSTAGNAMDQLEFLTIQKPAQSSKGAERRKSNMSTIEQAIQTIRRGCEELTVEGEVRK